MFSNEENGRRGAAQYAKDHSGELGQHVAAFEMDAGSGSPLGFMTEGEQPYLPEAREYAALLSPIGADAMVAGFSGEDVQALKSAGVPLFGVMLDLEHYFDVHHSAADTLDKVDPRASAKGRGRTRHLFLRCRRSTRRLAHASATEHSTVSREAAAVTAAPTQRLVALDLMRGLVMVLMTVDHSSDAFNAGRVFTDSVNYYRPGTPLPVLQFLVRWITHLVRAYVSVFGRHRSGVHRQQTANSGQNSDI
ncbi:MAG: M28 family peptidase [Pseudomonadota bacterium]